MAIAAAQTIARCGYATNYTQVTQMFDIARPSQDEIAAMMEKAGMPA